MKAITKTGLIAGVATWFVLSGFAVFQMSCIAASNCGVGHLIGLKAIVLGLIVPAYFVAFLVSKATNKEK